MDQKFAETLGDDGTEDHTVVGGPRDHVITSSTLIVSDDCVVFQFKFI